MVHSERRLWELDFARGIAVVMMLAFNWLYALYFLGFLSLQFFNTAPYGGWWFFARITAFSFVFISGFSLWLFYTKHVERHEEALVIDLKLLFRGVKLFGVGMLVTLATWVFFRQSVVLFGVLHLLGLSAILAIPLMDSRVREKILFAVSCVAVGVLLSFQSFDFPWMLWLGFAPKEFASFDYLPVLPWFGVFLAGIALGQYFRSSKHGLHWADRLEEKRFHFPLSRALAGVLCFLGRNSLAIYVIHQPLLIGALYLFGFNPLGLGMPLLRFG